MNKSENYAHFSSTLKSLFSLSRMHETKKINTVQEEGKKLLTFGALGWVKSTQILEKMGTNSPLKRHGERRSSAKMVGSGWGGGRRRAYKGQLSGG